MKLKTIIDYLLNPEELVPTAIKAGFFIYESNPSVTYIYAPEEKIIVRCAHKAGSYRYLGYEIYEEGKPSDLGGYHDMVFKRIRAHYELQKST